MFYALVLALALTSCGAAKRSKNRSDASSSATDATLEDTSSAESDVTASPDGLNPDGVAPDSELPDGCVGTGCLDGCTPGDPACGAPDVCGTEAGCNTDPCEPGTSFTAPDGCHLCVCSASGKKVDASCTTQSCDVDPCAGLPCGTPCNAGAGSPPSADAACNGDGQSVPGFSKLECPGAVICTTNVEAFPVHPRACKVNSDCTVVNHQLDCCVSEVALGSSLSGKSDFAAAEAVCRNQFNSCSCDPSETYAEDGAGPGPFEAWCDQGVCLSRAKQATTCTVSEPCTLGSTQCVPPGQSVECVGCTTAENFAFCSEDSDCDPSRVCLPSSAEDCACSPIYLCKPACFNDSDCGPGKACQNKRCITQLCGNDDGCPTNFECYGGYCSRRKCSSNGTCTGACVSGSCFEGVGLCMFPP